MPSPANSFSKYFKRNSRREFQGQYEFMNPEDRAKVKRTTNKILISILVLVFIFFAFLYGKGIGLTWLEKWATP